MSWYDYGITLEADTEIEEELAYAALEWLQCPSFGDIGATFDAVLDSNDSWEEIKYDLSWLSSQTIMKDVRIAVEKRENIGDGEYTLFYAYNGAVEQVEGELVFPKATIFPEQHKGWLATYWTVGEPEE